MNLQLRPASPRLLPVRKRGLRGLGDTCQVPQAGVAQVYPPCGGNYTGVPGATNQAQYQAPTLVPTPACASGPTMFTAECQAQVLAANQQRLAAANSANYSVDVANCEAAWKVNDQRYAELNTARPADQQLPRPPNDCAQRTFGLTPVGGFTGGVNVLVPQAQQLITGQTPASTAAGGGSGNPVLAFTNLTTGDNYNMRVGDRWQIDISKAAPSAVVQVIGGKDGAGALSNQGTTDASGRFSLNGQITQDQIGNWNEAWRVGGTPVGSFQFVVTPAGSGSVSKPATGGGTGTSSSSTLLSGSVDIGGVSIPFLALGAGALVLFFMMRGK